MICSFKKSKRANRSFLSKNELFARKTKEQIPNPDFSPNFCVNQRNPWFFVRAALDLRQTCSPKENCYTYSNTKLQSIPPIFVKSSKLKSGRIFCVVSSDYQTQEFYLSSVFYQYKYIVLWNLRFIYTVLNMQTLPLLRVPCENPNWLGVAPNWDRTQDHLFPTSHNIIFYCKSHFLIIFLCNFVLLLLRVFEVQISTSNWALNIIFVWISFQDFVLFLPSQLNFCWPRCGFHLYFCLYFQYYPTWSREGKQDLALHDFTKFWPPWTVLRE